MEHTDRLIRSIKRIDWAFIVLGIVEAILLFIVVQSYIAMIPGIITVILAYIALKENRNTWNLVSAIWALVKYNPVMLGMLTFILIDLILPAQPGRDVDSLAMLTVCSMIACMILFCVLGMVLLIKVARLKKLQKQKNGLSQ